jgi:hypothetical protein
LKILKNPKRRGNNNNKDGGTAPTLRCHQGIIQ